jgi:hypothetical protein
VVVHAKRVLDKAEIESLQKLRDDYQKALGISSQPPGSSLAAVVKLAT